MTPPNLSVYATSKGQAAANRIAHDEQLAKDLPAYKELRHQGFQPPKVDGSAVLQRDARDRLEVELGRRIPKADLSRAREVQQELAESKREGAFAGAFGDHQRSQR
jgi:hypothetical protein